MSKNISKFPNWICKKIDTAGIERVRAAVHAAELKTSAEIVPVIVQRSSAIAHVPNTLFLVLALAWVTALPFIAHYLTMFSLVVSEIIGFVVAFVLSILLSRFPFIQRLFVPKIDQEAQVDDRAELEFFESNIKATRDSTGVLIFVSLLEHRAVVLADKSISDKFPPETWSEIVKGLLEKIKGGDLAGGFAWAIERSGALVAPHFPIKTGDRNELANDLVIKP